MPDPTSAVDSSGATAPSAADATTAGDIAAANPDAKAIDSHTTISNMNELRTKAPKVFKAMMLGIAMQICREQQDHANRLKEMIRNSGN